MKTDIRKALLDGKVVIGSWIQIGPYPALSEILANVGYDWLGIDCEHSDIDIEGFTLLARGMYGRNAAPFARVRENDTLAIRQVLDAGAQGIIVPLVNSAEEALKAVSAAKYPPEGIRGFCFSRMNNYGDDFADYAASANEKITVIVMIESRQAVENIDEILSVNGVDGVFIGPYDLSGSYGITGQTTHATIKKACRTVIAACQKHCKAAGLHLVKPSAETIEETINEGFTFIALGVDMVFLNQASQAAFENAKKVLHKLECDQPNALK